tara:strand:+ start:944 stop:1096 length:153 start_codon:yes stop_codon:yes gene_type:complete
MSFSVNFSAINKTYCILIKAIATIMPHVKMINFVPLFLEYAKMAHKVLAI